MKTCFIYGGGVGFRLFFLFAIVTLFFSCSDIGKRDFTITNKSTYDTILCLSEYKDEFKLEKGASVSRYIYSYPNIVVNNDAPVEPIVSIDWCSIVDIPKSKILIKNLCGNDIKIVSNKWNDDIFLNNNEKRYIELYISNVTFKIYEKKEAEWIEKIDCEFKKLDNSTTYLIF